jgi:hypothetical protein
MLATLVAALVAAGTGYGVSTLAATAPPISVPSRGAVVVSPISCDRPGCVRTDDELWVRLLNSKGVAISNRLVIGKFGYRLSPGRYSLVAALPMRGPRQVLRWKPASFVVHAGRTTHANLIDVPVS